MKKTGGWDSFVLHRKIMTNQRMIAETGIDEFISRQQKRISFLESALALYDDWRSQNFFCIAAALLSIEGLNKALVLAENGEPIKPTLNRFAEMEGQELKLRKNGK